MIEPHEVRDDEKLESMIAEIEAGNDLPPVAVTFQGVAITGSHRIAAYRACGYMDEEIPQVGFEDKYIEEYCPEWDGRDFSVLCEAIYQNCDWHRPLKRALQDQF